MLTAKIKTDAIWARIIRNCLLSLVARYIYIPNRFNARARPPSIRVHTFQAPIIRCSKGGKTWNLHWSVTAFLPPRLLFSDTLFISSISLSLRPVRFRLCLAASPGMSPLPGSLSPFLLLSFLPSVAFLRLLPISVSNRSASRRASERAKASKWRLFPLFLFRYSNCF